MERRYGGNIDLRSSSSTSSFDVDSVDSDVYVPPGVLLSEVTNEIKVMLSSSKDGPMHEEELNGGSEALENVTAMSLADTLNKKASDAFSAMFSLQGDQDVTDKESSVGEIASAGGGAPIISPDCSDDSDTTNFVKVVDIKALKEIMKSESASASWGLEKLGMGDAASKMSARSTATNSQQGMEVVPVAMTTSGTRKSEASVVFGNSSSTQESRMAVGSKKSTKSTPKKIKSILKKSTLPIVIKKRNMFGMRKLSKKQMTTGGSLSPSEPKELIAMIGNPHGVHVSEGLKQSWKKKGNEDDVAPQGGWSGAAAGWFGKSAAPTEAANKPLIFGAGTGSSGLIEFLTKSEGSRGEHENQEGNDNEKMLISPPSTERTVISELTNPTFLEHIEPARAGDKLDEIIYRDSSADTDGDTFTADIETGTDTSADTGTDLDDDTFTISLNSSP